MVFEKSAPFAGFRLVIADTLWGFPCCVPSPCVHAVATTPAQRLGVLFALVHPAVSAFPKALLCRPAHCPFRGLISVHSRYGLHTRAVTNSWHANRRLQPFHYLHDCSDCFRLARLPGGAHTYWKAPPLHGAHPQRTSDLSGVWGRFCSTSHSQHARKVARGATCATAASGHVAAAQPISLMNFRRRMCPP